MCGLPASPTTSAPPAHGHLRQPGATCPPAPMCPSHHVDTDLLPITPSHQRPPAASHLDAAISSTAVMSGLPRPPSAVKNLRPLFCMGMWEAVIIMEPVTVEPAAADADKPHHLCLCWMCSNAIRTGVLVKRFGCIGSTRCLLQQHLSTHATQLPYPPLAVKKASQYLV